jgi:thiamine-monophosphate kinase
MERDFIHWLRQRLPKPSGVAIGVGDDAAVLDLSLRQTLVTVDMLTDGVDFILAEAEPRRIGRKALAVNLSDIAAMAGEPRAAFVAVALPREGAGDLARELAEGMLPLAEQYGVTLAGGDTNTWDGPLVISVTLLGTASDRGPLLRSGAKPGDKVLVTGSLGGSILGRHFDFEPRIREALLLHRQYTLHAGMDISDGLLLDLSRLTEESKCGARLDLAQVPVAENAHRLDDRKSPLEHALTDGEDFELILAVPAEEAERLLADQPLDVPLTCVGEFVTEPGLCSTDGSRLEPRGWEH